MLFEMIKTVVVRDSTITINAMIKMTLRFHLPNFRARLRIKDRIPPIKSVYPLVCVSYSEVI